MVEAAGARVVARQTGGASTVSSLTVMALIGDVAGVGDGVAVGDAVADAVVGSPTGDRLVDGQRRALAVGMASVSLPVAPSAGGRGDGVGDAAAGVEVGLGDGVGGGAGRRRSVGPRLVARQTGAVVGVGVGQGEPGQGDVAGVGHRVAVGDDLAGRGDRRRGRGLDDGQGRRSGRADGEGVGRRGDDRRALVAGKVKLPEALAMLVTEPASMSAWVTV